MSLVAFFGAAYVSCRREAIEEQLVFTQERFEAAKHKVTMLGFRGFAFACWVAQQCLSGQCVCSSHLFWRLSKHLSVDTLDVQPGSQWTVGTTT